MKNKMTLILIAMIAFAVLLKGFSFITSRPSEPKPIVVDVEMTEEEILAY